MRRTAVLPRDKILSDCDSLTELLLSNGIIESGLGRVSAV